jgi:uncharacterized alpha-E superfamily protein
VAQQRLARLLDSLSIPSAEYDLSDSDTILRRLTLDPTFAPSIVATVTVARENARQVREQISSEMWMQINRTYLNVVNANFDAVWASPHDFYLSVREESHLFQGITDATMNHNQGWHFIQLGRYMERAFGLLHLLDTHFHGTDWKTQDGELLTRNYFEFVASLKSVTAFEAYCKVYNPNIQPGRIIEFLLFNEVFPRSLRFCVEMIMSSLESLTESTERSRHSRLFRVGGRMQSALSYDDLNDVRDLREYLRNIEHHIALIHDTLYDTFITYPIEYAL